MIILNGTQFERDFVNFAMFTVTFKWGTSPTLENVKGDFV